MTATSFQLVKSVLDDLRRALSKRHGAKADDVVKKRLASLSGQYARLSESERVPIDYADPATRAAYLFRYTAAHSAYVRAQMLRSLPLQALLQSEEPVRIACVGGGPGSELVGILQACVELQRTARLIVWLLDREESWAETWAEVDEQLDAPFTLTTHSRQVDVTKYSTFDNLEKALSSDLFVLSFFLSEIYSFRDDAKNFFGEMTDRMPTGALVLYLDNEASMFGEYAESLFPSSRFKLLSEKNERLLPGGSEQRSDLGDYLTRFDGNPKIQSQASVRLWKKL